MRSDIYRVILGVAFLCFALVTRAVTCSQNYLNAVSGDCERPPEVEYASYNDTGSPPFLNGTVLRYDCNIGYTTNGTSRFYTCSGTEWNGEYIVCDPVRCPYIASPDNGYYVNTPTRKAGTDITFACDEGHDMSGTSILTCRTDGYWSPVSSAPTCTPKDCGEFGYIANGETFQDTSLYEMNHYAISVKVTCNYGYELEGSRYVDCQADGTWGPKPTCERKTCPPYPNINSACVSNVDTFGGSYLIINCKEGDNVSVTHTDDNMVVECLSTYQWDRLDVACFCDCFIGRNQTTVEFTNLNSKFFLPHNHILHWRCGSGLQPSDVNIQCYDGELYASGRTVDSLAKQNLCVQISTTQTTVSATSDSGTEADSTIFVPLSSTEVEKQVSDMNGIETSGSDTITQASTETLTKDTSNAETETTISSVNTSMFTTKTWNEQTTKSKTKTTNTSNSTLVFSTESWNEQTQDTETETTNTSNSTSMPPNAVSGDCEGPPQVENASYNDTGSSSYPSGTVLRYGCNIGYTTSGTSRFYTCSDTEWTGGYILCDPIRCPYIASPDNGYYVNTPTREAGTDITFACDEGHDMSGTSILTCRTDGYWSPVSSAPTCTPKDCGEFGSVQNGETFQDTSLYEMNHYAISVKVTCDYGYELEGSRYVDCQADGTWGPKPTCERKTCPPYPSINSACVSNVDTFGGSYLIINCKEGDNVSVTQTDDNMVVECLSTYQWDRLGVACFCDCFIGRNQTTVEFTNLNSKFFLPHSHILHWRCGSGLQPSDINIQCNDGELYASGRTVDSLAKQNLCVQISTTQTTVSVTSDSGTEADSTIFVPLSSTEVEKQVSDMNGIETSGSDTITQASTETLTKDTSTAETETTISSVNTSMFTTKTWNEQTTKTTNTSNSTLVFTTESWNEQTQDTETETTNTSKSTSMPPNAVSGDCEGPPKVDNASYNDSGSSPYPSGTVLRYDCNIGYTTSGTSRFYTCSDTKWTGGYILCDPVRCPYIASPDNGYYVNTPTREAGTDITFACDEGHDMSGTSILTCRTDGYWSPVSSAPTCTPKDCGEFGSVQNGETFQDTSLYEMNHYAISVKVTCDYGYELEGSRYVDCQADGTWGPKPTCERKTCPPYPNINSACVSNVDTFGGSYMIINCKEGNNVSVTQTDDYMEVECLSTYQWNRLDVACFCDCFIGRNQTTVEFTNLNSIFFLPHNHMLHWRCGSGLQPSDVRIQCNDGEFHVSGRTVDSFAKQNLCVQISTTQTTVNVTSDSGTEADSTTFVPSSSTEVEKQVSDMNGIEKTSSNTTTQVSTETLTEDYSYAEKETTITSVNTSMFTTKTWNEQTTNSETKTTNTSNSTSMFTTESWNEQTPDTDTETTNTSTSTSLLSTESWNKQAPDTETETTHTSNSSSIITTESSNEQTQNTKTKIIIKDSVTQISADIDTESESSKKDCPDVRTEKVKDCACNVYFKTLFLIQIICALFVVLIE